ncbi:hypothetical protein [Belliella aquatica]|uniref:hypothetical protein n=1 Tax=Belliella aquatica TaxID=1323734 RepID=UPI00166CF877|nr:hypothetical protein [Belliella aquatica]MCH7406893.1 hypothetical protein [Belliella aquatica]
MEIKIPIKQKKINLNDLKICLSATISVGIFLTNNLADKSKLAFKRKWLAVHTSLNKVFR